MKSNRSLAQDKPCYANELTSGGADKLVDIQVLGCEPWEPKLPLHEMIPDLNFGDGL